MEGNTVDWQQSGAAYSLSHSVDISNPSACFDVNSGTANITVNFILLIGHMADVYELERADFLKRLNVASNNQQGAGSSAADLTGEPSPATATNGKQL